MNKYVGMRYVPLVKGEWVKANSYDPLEVVLYLGSSYTSKTFVPPNTEISNSDYWVLSGNYNAQTELYRQEVNEFKEDILKSYSNLNVDIVFPPQASGLPGAKGDGVTDDSAAINAIIAWVSAQGGGTVVVPHGYTFIFTSIKVKTKVRFFSNGGILKLKNNTCNNASQGYYLVENMGEDNVIFDSLIIDGNSANNTLFTVADGITAGGENCVVSNCHLYNIPDSGIMFSGAKHSICVSNRINGCRDVGIYVNDGSGSNAYDNIIAWNRITGVTNTGIALKRICNKFLVDGNIISGGDNGITLEHASTAVDYSWNVTIVNNRITDCLGLGIDVRFAPYCVVANNRIQNFGRIAILMQGNSYGVNISDNVLNADGLNADDAYLYKASIVLTGRDGAFPHHNVISGNTFTSGSAKYIGIWLMTLETKTVGGNYNIFIGNVMNGAGSYGLRGSSAYTYNMFSNNVLSGTTLDVYLDTATFSQMTDNSLMHNTDDAISSQYNIVAVRGKRRTIIAGGPPATGFWNVGDMVEQGTPGAGGTRGWICTVAGTPGTWISVGVFGS